MGRTRTTKSPDPDSAEVIERERRVLELRRAGVTFDVIAEQLDYADRSGAYRAFKRALARTLQQPAREVRDLEVDRLDKLMVAVWKKALGGDLQAVDRVIRISERRARLLGLDAPQKVQVGDQLDSQIEALLTELGAPTPGVTPMDDQPAGAEAGALEGT